MKEFIVISDLHAGSKFSVTKTPHNSIQRALKKIWDEMIENLESHTLAGGINLGDSVDGPDRHGNGKYNDTNNILEQIMNSAGLLEDIPVKDWYTVQGSPYHTSENVSSDEYLSNYLKGTFGEDMVINIDGIRVHASHSVGVSMSGTAYRTTPIAREMMLNAINVQEYGKYNIILRGHAHYFVMVRFGGSSGVIAPCWKGRDAFASRRTLAMMPHIGYLLIQVDNGTYNIEPHVYTLKGKDLVNEVKV